MRASPPIPQTLSSVPQIAGKVALYRDIDIDDDHEELYRTAPELPVKLRTFPALLGKNSETLPDSLIDFDYGMNKVSSNQRRMQQMQFFRRTQNQLPVASDA